MFGPFGISVMVTSLSVKFSKFQTGFLYHYAFIMLLSATIFMAMVNLDMLLSLQFDYRLLPIYFLLSSILAKLNR
jgi:hypothetical protein